MGAKDNLSVTSSVASMKKWGIPQQQTPEIALLERLVWVKYKTHWWPALLYYSYSELQHHLYDQLDMVLKAQFAMAIMKQMQERREVKVARLLGRSILEVAEVEEDSYCEFYWQLPNILPIACKRSHYGRNEELYFDFHRALDQVEGIIREVSQESFALLPDSDNTTWLERAHMAVSQKEEDTSSISRSMAGTNRHSKNHQEHLKTAASIVSKGNSTIATEQSGLKGVGSDVSKASVGSNSKRTSTHDRNSRNNWAVQPTPSALSKSKSQETEPRTPSEAKSRRSTKTKDSQAMTEVMDNRTSVYSATQSRPAVIEERRDPPSSCGSSANNSDKLNQDNFKSKTVAQDDFDKVAEKNMGPPSQPRPETRQHQFQRRTQLKHDRGTSPLQVLPGLEPDDIVPGSNSTWKNVLGYMSGSRDPAPEEEEEEETTMTQDNMTQDNMTQGNMTQDDMTRDNYMLQDNMAEEVSCTSTSNRSGEETKRDRFANISEATMPSIQNKEMQNLIGTNHKKTKNNTNEEDDETLYVNTHQSSTKKKQKQPGLSFWQRLTCYSTEF